MTPVQQLCKFYNTSTSNFQLVAICKEMIQVFETKWNMVQCARAIDGCHIPVRPPVLNHTDYYNRKGWYSSVLQGIVDHQYLFQDINVSWPGSIHDAHVFANSLLYHKAQNKEILNSWSRNISGVNVCPFLVWDSAYPLSTWIMKPFLQNSDLTDREKIITTGYHVHA